MCRNVQLNEGYEATCNSFGQVQTTGHKAQPVLSISARLGANLQGVLSFSSVQ